MFYNYILQSQKDKKWYTGYASDLRKRFNEHNSNKSGYTKGRGPFVLIYYEACLNEQDAKRREDYFKTSQGQRLLKRRLKEYFYNQK